MAMAKMLLVLLLLLLRQTVPYFQSVIQSTGMIAAQNGNTYSNLAVSGSISSSSLTGDLGILARKASETIKNILAIIKGRIYFLCHCHVMLLHIEDCRLTNYELLR